VAEASTQSDANTKTKFFMNQALLFFYFLCFSFYLFIFLSCFFSPTEFLFIKCKLIHLFILTKEVSFLKKDELSINKDNPYSLT